MCDADCGPGSGLPSDEPGWDIITPDSMSTACSCSLGGNMYGSHLLEFLSCSVAPSIFFRMVRVSSLSRVVDIASVGEIGPKTSATASWIWTRRVW